MSLKISPIDWELSYLFPTMNAECPGHQANNGTTTWVNHHHSCMLPKKQCSCDACSCLNSGKIPLVTETLLQNEIESLEGFLSCEMSRAWLSKIYMVTVQTAKELFVVRTQCTDRIAALKYVLLKIKTQNEDYGCF